MQTDPSLAADMLAKGLPVVTKSGNQVTIQGTGQPNETVHLVIKNRADNSVVEDVTGQLDEDGYRKYGPITLANGNYTIRITKEATGTFSEINVTVP